MSLFQNYILSLSQNPVLVSIIELFRIVFTIISSIYHYMRDPKKQIMSFRIGSLFDFILYREIVYISKNLVILNGNIFTYAFLPNRTLG